MDKKDSPLKVYSIVSQIGFIVICPLIIFIWGGSYIVERFNLPDWLTIVFILLGIVTMISGAATYLSNIIKMYDTDKKTKYSHLPHDRKDNDYYEENSQKKRL